MQTPISHYANESIKDAKYIITEDDSSRYFQSFHWNAQPDDALEFSSVNYTVFPSHSDAAHRCTRMIGQAELNRDEWGDEKTDKIISRIKNFKFKPKS